MRFNHLFLCAPFIFGMIIGGFLTKGMNVAHITDKYGYGYVLRLTVKEPSSPR